MEEVWYWFILYTFDSENEKKIEAHAVIGFNTEYFPIKTAEKILTAFTSVEQRRSVKNVFIRDFKQVPKGTHDEYYGLDEYYKFP